MSRTLLEYGDFEGASVEDWAARFVLHGPNQKYNVVPVTYGLAHPAISTLNNLGGFGGAPGVDVRR